MGREVNFHDGQARGRKEPFLNFEGEQPRGARPKGVQEQTEGAWRKATEAWEAHFQDRPTMNGLGTSPTPFAGRI